MVVFIFSRCPVTAEGYRHLIESVDSYAHIFCIDKISDTPIPGVFPQIIFIKTLGFQLPELLAFSFDIHFPGSKKIWIKSPYDKADEMVLSFDHVMDMETETGKIKEALIEIFQPHRAFLKDHKSNQWLDVLSRHGKLKENEAFIFHKMTLGKTYKEIAADMGISVRTVEKIGSRLKSIFGLPRKEAFKLYLPK